MYAFETVKEQLRVPVCIWIGNKIRQSRIALRMIGESSLTKLEARKISPASLLLPKCRMLPIEP